MSTLGTTSPVTCSLPCGFQVIPDSRDSNGRTLESLMESTMARKGKGSAHRRASGRDSQTSENLQPPAPPPPTLGTKPVQSPGLQAQVALPDQKSRVDPEPTSAWTLTHLQLTLSSGYVAVLLGVLGWPSRPRGLLPPDAEA